MTTTESNYKATETHFCYATDDYHRDFNFLDNYKKQMAIGLSLANGISIEEASKFITEQFSNGVVSPKDITLKTTVRKRNGDREIKEMPTLDYFKKIEQGQLGMGPTLTTFYNPNQKKSLIAESIAVDMAERKVEKKLAIKAKGFGDRISHTLHNGMQNAIKTLINSWSGAALDKNNIFSCRSTHPVLTSCCRITTATCTAAAERFTAGIRFYYNVEVLIEDFLFTLQVANTLLIREFIDRFSIHKPTTDEVMDMVVNSTKYYWEDSAALNRIRNMVDNMTGYERATILYTYDFNHFCQYNDSYARNFITELINIDPAIDEDSLPNDKEETGDWIGALNGDQQILLGNLLTPYLVGQGSIYDVLKKNKDSELILRMKRVARNILNVVDKYQYYIRAFMKCHNHPLHLGKQNSAIRNAVPLGDTDSSLISIIKPSEWFYGSCDFTKAQEPIQDAMTYLVTQLFEHLLAMFTAQLGVIPENRKLLIMKNEFKFNSLMLTPVAKTYHALTIAQEGILMGSPEYELKGARFHASKSNASLIKEFKTLQEENLQKLSRGETIDRGEVIDKIMSMEEDILQSIDRKDNPYFLNVKVKPAEEYKVVNVSNYPSYELWNGLFGSSWGKANPPTYTAAKVPVHLSNKTEISNWLATLTTAQQNAFNAWREKFNKTGNTFKLTNILIPLEIINEKGIPPEIKPIVNFRRMIGDILDPYYLYLSAMGIHYNYKDNRKLLSDVIT